MDKIEEPENLQKLRFLLNSVNLIETCMNNSLISVEDKTAFLKSLNDKSHKLIDALIKGL